MCVEAQVDGLTTISSEESLSQLKASIGDLLESLSDTVDNFQTALHFVLLKVYLSIRLVVLILVFTLVGKLSFDTREGSSWFEGLQTSQRYCIQPCCE